MSARLDPELDELFSDEPDLRELAQLLRSTPHPAAGVEPSAHFRMSLRRRLMREAWERAQRPAPPWYRRLLEPSSLTWAGAAVGALLVVFAGFTFATVTRPQQAPVTVTSPLNRSQTVSVVRPIELTFNQPMDPSTTEQSVRIEPALLARYSWQDNNQRLVITPVHDLAANTRYDVTVAPTAKTQAGQTVAKTHVVTFVTVAPTPTPTPTPTSSPSSTPSPVLDGARPVAPVGTPAVDWSADGRLFVVGPAGQLQAWPVRGGPAAPVAPDGVTLVEVGPDGNPAYVRAGTLVYDSLDVSGVQPIALGFHAGTLEFATATDVQTGGQQRLASLSETATAADFSPTGGHLAYIGASGLHLLDLGTGKDVAVGPASGLGDWSSDGHQYAYPTETSVMVADVTTGASAKLFDLAGVTGLSWSRGNQLLASTAASLYVYNASDGTGLRKLADGSYASPEWAPDGSGTFAYRQAGQVWVARLTGALAGTAPAAGLSQDDLVNAFMTARKNLLPDRAMSFLDSAGKDAFGKLTLVYTDPSSPLSRYYVLLSQPGRVVVRLVITSGSGQSAIDEVLLIQRDASGRPWIHGVSETVRSSFASGPEVVRVTVQNGQVQVLFDSDLDPTSVRASVSIRGVSSRATYDPSQKMVTLTVPGGLNVGQTYDLLVGTGLQDVQSRPAVPYDLQFTGE